MIPLPLLGKKKQKISAQGSDTGAKLAPVSDPRAERRAGEILAEMEKNPGAATQLHDVTALPPKLEDLGISRTQSHPGS
jgi:hypothetical protein